MRRLVPLLVIWLVACSIPGSDRPPADVTLYVRNLADTEAVLVLQPQTEPPTILGFGALGDQSAASLGAGCFSIPIGSSVWLLDALGLREGGHPQQRLLTVTPADMGGLVAWAEVGADRVAAVGHGKPAWWEGDDQKC